MSTFNCLNVLRFLYSLIYSLYFLLSSFIVCLHLTTVYCISCTINLSYICELRQSIS
nr:MAG TPA: hypothetical protein [Caudoviricetes sp.]